VPITAFVDTSPHHAVFGDRSVVHPVAARKGGPHRRETLERKSARLASVALANKMARIAWSVLTRGEVYRDIHPVPKPT
jgi:hypothetical protein